MRPATRNLLVVTVAVVAADVAWRAWPRPSPEALPTLPGFDPRDAVRLEIAQVDRAVQIERRGEGWWLVAPTDAPADDAEVEAALSVLAGGIHPVARLDRADQDRYGLEGGQELRVEVVGSGSTLLSVVVGADTVGGDSFVRFPGAPDVFRADVGGRALLARPAGRWRDRTVVDLDPAAVTEIVVRSGAGVVRATRTPTGFDGGVDQATVARLVAELAHLRAAEVVDEGPDGLARVELGTTDDRVVLSFGSDGVRTVVRREGRPEVFRLALPWVEHLADPSVLLDRAIWTVPPAEVRSIRLEGPGWDGRLDREADGSLRLVRPANLVVDPQRLAAAVALMSQPRVVAWGQAEARFPGHRLVVEAADGRHVLEVGEAEGDRRPVREAGRPERAGWMDAELIRKLLTIFGSPD
ncbi:MAG: DUF4340 domain-containing protein [Alphaproteobacteria bacterium]|nr:DUF4340 domain-containing protein [Alphaproteobacteria bacterium]MCB9696056.1 DUF4340 domain-containing protein [Alphaproteobacteria bacterium]